MILSQLHKYIFVAIPKTATHAVRETLRPTMGPYDWEQCNLFVKKRIPIAHIAKLQHGHLTAHQIRELLPKGSWKEYQSFCFVRNPIDRFVSFAYFVNRNNSKMQDDPSATLKAIVSDRAIFERKILLKPQHHFTHYKGEQLIQQIGRYEHFKDDFISILDSLDLSDQSKRIHVKNESKNPRNVVLPSSVKNFVKDYYRKDFDLFEYEA